MLDPNPEHWHQVPGYTICLLLRSVPEPEGGEEQRIRPQVRLVSRPSQPGNTNLQYIFYRIPTAANYKRLIIGDKRHNATNIITDQRHYATNVKADKRHKANIITDNPLNATNVMKFVAFWRLSHLRFFGASLLTFAAVQCPFSFFSVVHQEWVTGVFF